MQPEPQQEIMAGASPDPSALDVAGQCGQCLVPGDTLADDAIIEPLGGAGPDGTQRACLLCGAFRGQIDSPFRPRAQVHLQRRGDAGESTPATRDTDN